MVSKQEFAQKIKAKYPAYAKLDDNTLTDKVLAKYPVYAKQIDQTSQYTPDQQSQLDKYKQEDNKLLGKTVTYAAKMMGLDAPTREEAAKERLGKGQDIGSWDVEKERMLHAVSLKSLGKGIVNAAALKFNPLGKLTATTKLGKLGLGLGKTATSGGAYGLATGINEKIEGKSNKEALDAAKKSALLGGGLHLGGQAIGGAVKGYDKFIFDRSFGKFSPKIKKMGQENPLITAPPKTDTEEMGKKLVDTFKGYEKETGDILKATKGVAFSTEKKMPTALFKKKIEQVKGKYNLTGKKVGRATPEVQDSELFKDVVDALKIQERVTKIGEGKKAKEVIDYVIPNKMTTKEAKTVLGNIDTAMDKYYKKLQTPKFTNTPGTGASAEVRRFVSKLTDSNLRDVAGGKEYLKAKKNYATLQGTLGEHNDKLRGMLNKDDVISGMKAAMKENNPAQLDRILKVNSMLPKKDRIAEDVIKQIVGDEMRILKGHSIQHTSDLIGALYRIGAWIPQANVRRRFATALKEKATDEGTNKLAKALLGAKRAGKRSLPYAASKAGQE